MPHIDVCLTPELIHRYNLQHKIVVIVDILRATSCMVTAFAHGATCIVPATTQEACMQMKSRGYIAACEENGKKVAGFDKGNSPFEYMDRDIQGAKIALKTTNGTRAIELTKQAPTILIGSFLNLTALTDYIQHQQDDILIVCAGWRGEVNMEDTLFAGAVVDTLQAYAEPRYDTPIIAQKMYLSAKKNMPEFLRTSSHFQRLNRLGHYEDIAFCLTTDRYSIVPMLKERVLAL